ncbi:MAG: DUF1015 domain-containing protein [Ruminococcaceae bacterium]|nr:DUF1015 domain-containing protein [Oscillospiraceae bacterium]
MSETKKYLYPANILLPKENFEKWAVVACDQYTSEPDYWNDVDSIVGNTASALRVTLPEIYLSDNVGKRIENINATMKKYLDGGIFDTFENSMIYVEREISSGKIRHGIVGALDLEAYDWHPGSKSLIRATEQTVIERIPPRVEIRKNAPLELPHILILIDDPDNKILGNLEASKADMKKAYDFDLMKNSGHISGYLIDSDAQDAVNKALSEIISSDGMLFAVGDGNHSLATAKECYTRNPSELSRYALCEIVNIHDDSLVFEPIFRVMFGVSPSDVLSSMEKYFGSCGENSGSKVRCIFGGEEKDVYIPTNGSLTVGALQNFIDSYIKEHAGAEVDYIHGEEVVEILSRKENTIGFIFDGMKKSELFPAIMLDGVLPRKTFSMGHASDKRFYIEARKIK